MMMAIHATNTRDNIINDDDDGNDNDDIQRCIFHNTCVTENDNHINFRLTWQA